MSVIPSYIPIAALPADSSHDVQNLMEQFGDYLSELGLNVSGVTQHRKSSEEKKSNIILKNYQSKESYLISQDLGPGSVACNLDSSQLAHACAAIERSITENSHLILISKFSKQEAARGGLCDAFRIAMSRGIPVLTTVSPYVAKEWTVFAGPLAENVSPSFDAILEWWNRISAKNNPL